MINMQTISEEISKLENSQASFPVCQKLADLYIVREHLMKKQQGGNYARNRRNYENYGNYNYGNYENYEQNRGRSNYENYERGGNGGNDSSQYTMYNEYYDDRMMDEDMMMGGMKSPRMSMPSMR